MLLTWRNLPSPNGLMPALTMAHEPYPTACQTGLAPSTRDASTTALPFRVHLWHPRVAQKEQRLLGVP
jgi:hypothetical protein